MAEQEGKAPAKAKRTQDSQPKRVVAEPEFEKAGVETGELSPILGLLDSVRARPSVERHAALLGDYHLSHPANAGIMAQLVLQLQRSYGNSYVQRVVSRIQNQPEEKETAPKLTQTVYWFEVHFVDNGKQAKLQVGELEEKAELARKPEASPKKKPAEVYSYAYIADYGWAWEETSKGGKPVRIEQAEIDATSRLRKAENSVDRSNLDEQHKEIAKAKIFEIRRKITECFNLRAPEPLRRETIQRESGRVEKEERHYKGEMNTGEFSTINFLTDDVKFVSGGGAKVKAAEPATTKPAVTTPKIDIPNKIEIKGFGFGSSALPATGEGREQLNKLCQLDARTKAGIVITAISGYTDKVPVRPGSRYSDNTELSKMRINSVVVMLNNAGFKPPQAIVPLGEKGAAKDVTARNQERAEDRKVVIEWRQEASK